MLSWLDKQTTKWPHEKVESYLHVVQKCLVTPVELQETSGAARVFCRKGETHWGLQEKNLGPRPLLWLQMRPTL